MFARTPTLARNVPTLILPALEIAAIRGAEKGQFAGFFQKKSLTIINVANDKFPMKWIAFFAVLLVSGFSFSLIPIGSCAVLNTDGETYQLTTSVSGAPNIYYGGYYTCIQVNASNVILDCIGYNVTSTDDSAIEIEWPGDNVTIRNCTLINGHGIDIMGLRNSNISGNTIYPSYAGISGVLSYGGGDMNNVISFNNITGGSYGIWEPPDNSRISNNRMMNQGGVSLIIGSTNVTAVNNYINGSAGFGMEIDGNSLNVSYNVVANSSQNGVSFNPYNTTFSFNNVSDSGQYGMRAGYSDYTPDFCTISDNRFQDSSWDGLHMSGATYVNVTNNVIENNDVGLWVQPLYGEGYHPTNNLLISGNTIRNNAGVGINITTAMNSEVNSNNVTLNGGTGIRVSDSFGIVIDPSVICNNAGDGVDISDSNYVSVLDSVICNNSASGVYASNSNYSNISGNTLYGNGWYGVSFDGGDNSSISNNTAFDNLDGFYSIYIYNFTYVNNTAYGNNGGFAISSASADCTYINNNASSNTGSRVWMAETGGHTFINNTANSNERTASPPTRWATSH